jgi:malonyl-CoA decarboxylase
MKTYLQLMLILGTLSTSRLDRFRLGDFLSRRRQSKELGEREREALRKRMQECLEGRGGEVTARARAAELGRLYLELDDQGRGDFLTLLASFDSDQRAITEAARRLGSGEDKAACELRQLLVPPYVTLLRQFNALPDGTKFLVDLRADLRRLERERPLLAPLERELRQLLADWFDVGFLELRQLDWNSPAAILERLAQSEAVHPFAGWEDLKHRLGSDRRLFVFFHPRLPEEPLIFVEVALTRELPEAIGPLLDPKAAVDDPSEATTAIFYSISNAQPGLAGVSFGGFLVSQVVEALKVDYPKLEQFATLSPLPGFCDWLELQLRAKDTLLPSESAALVQAGFEPSTLVSRLREGTWADDRTQAEPLRRSLERLALVYLLAKRPDGRTVDPVAHFHLGNGARVERLNWLADRSSKGFDQSAGLMVNYLYALKEIDPNHEAYSASGAVALSSRLHRAVRDTN